MSINREEPTPLPLGAIQAFLKSDAPEREKAAIRALLGPALKALALEAAKRPQRLAVVQPIRGGLTIPPVL